ncbi:ROK family protein [Umezawaea sp. NPDC059074]|uniref:ROK family protein n=1 Tax=Umezawaea sp. NPDC059074 TaxID=3346716 RepID=UPI00369399BF
MTAPVAVLEIGGTHVTAALVHHRVLPGRTRASLAGDASADAIIDAIVTAARGLGPAPRWAVAVPGPFDYATGTALFHGVGKFDALHGVNLREVLLGSLDGAESVVFLNDANAFLLGEVWAGAAAGHRRAVAITLGTGVGSAFADNGSVVEDGPGVPPEGRADLLTFNGRPLEETVSRRAIRAAYERATGVPAPDVHDIADRARAGDQAATEVLHRAFHALGATLAPWVAAFEATVLVVGGSMAGSWDLVAGPLREGVAVDSLAITPAAHPEDAALLGAAHLDHGILTARTRR